VAYLIDGNNLLGYLSPEKLRDSRSKRLLISTLSLFQRVKKTKILVVFDGAPDPDLISKDFRRKTFSVFFPDLEENADQVIKRIIEKQTDLRNFYVVSSDREIRAFTKAKRAKSISCKDFSKLLKSSLRTHKKSLEAKKKEIFLSPLEVDHWLEIFGGEK